MPLVCDGGQPSSGLQSPSSCQPLPDFFQRLHLSVPSGESSSGWWVLPSFLMYVCFRTMLTGLLSPNVSPCKATDICFLKVIFNKEDGRAGACSNGCIGVLLYHPLSWIDEHQVQMSLGQILILAIHLVLVFLLCIAFISPDWSCVSLLCLFLCYD